MFVEEALLYHKVRSMAFILTDVFGHKEAKELRKVATCQLFPVFSTLGVNPIKRTLSPPHCRT